MYPSRWPRDTLYPQNLALTSSTSGGRSVGVVRSRTQATEFFILVWKPLKSYRVNVNMNLKPGEELEHPVFSYIICCLTLHNQLDWEDVVKHEEYHQHSVNAPITLQETPIIM
jgi:hypothetical protein